MIVNVKRNGSAHVFELANRASVQKIEGESLSAFTIRMDNHESGLNANAHGIPNIAGLQTALNSKSNTGHGHTQGEISGLSGSLDGKSNVGHGHVIGDVTGLNQALESKADLYDLDKLTLWTEDQLATKQDAFTGYTGSISFIKTVNFGSQTTTTGTINVVNGIIVSTS